MKSFTIMSRVIKELLRDKRTLALMFVAPILILFLMNLIFNVSSTTSLDIGTVSVDSGIVKQLDDTKHVEVKKYDTQKAAKKAMKDQKIDAVIYQDGTHYSLTYANTDSSKTAATKMAFKNAVSTEAMDKLKTALTGLAQKVGAPVDLSSNKMTISNHYAYGDSDTGYFAKMVPVLLGFFVFFFVFLISGMALLKERTSGTLDRLLATPVKRSEIVFGYLMSYGVLAVVQTIIIVTVGVWLLNIEVVGSLIAVIIINILLALVALSFGILLSTFAKSEFQMMQFIPLIVVPQVFFSGIISLDSMAKWVQAISYIMPIKYAGDAQSQIILHGASITSLGFDIGILILFAVVLTTLNIVGLRRYRKV